MLIVSGSKSCSESLRCSSIDACSLLNQLTDGLADLSLICSEQVNLTLDAILVASRDAWLGLVALTHQEWQIWVRTLHCLVVVSDEGSE